MTDKAIDDMKQKILNEYNKTVKIISLHGDYYESISDLNVLLHDVYTVCRMFKPEMRNCLIFYGGAYHTEQLKQMILDYAGGTLVYDHNIDYDDYDLGLVLDDSSI